MSFLSESRRTHPPSTAGSSSIFGGALALVAVLVAIRTRRKGPEAPIDVADLPDHLRRDIGVEPRDDSRDWWDFRQG